MTEMIVRASPRAVTIAAAIPAAAAIVTFGNPKVFAGALLAAIAMFYGWAWAVGHAVNRRITAPHRPSIGGFRLSLLYCAAYVSAFVLTTAGADWSFTAAHFGGILVLHGLAMAATLNTLRFLASNLAIAEEEAGVAPAPAGRATLELTSIAGILPLQKRLNRLFDAA